MTDAELADFCGVPANDPLREKFIQTLTPEKRGLFERMASIEIEVRLWQEGLGPKPQGVLIDTVRDTKRRRAWR